MRPFAFALILVWLSAGRAEGALLYLTNADDGGSQLVLAGGDSGDMNIMLTIRDLDTGFAFANVFLDDDDNQDDSWAVVTGVTPGLTEPEGMVTYDRSAFELPADISWNGDNEYGLVMGRQDGNNWGPGNYVLDTLTITRSGELDNPVIPVTFEEGARAPAIFTADFFQMPWNTGLEGIIPNFVDPGVGSSDNPFIITTPEPGTLLLLGVTAAAMLRRRRTVPANG